MKTTKNNELPKFDVDFDPIIEKYYEYELDGIVVRKSWTGLASKMNDDMIFDTGGIPIGATINVKFDYNILDKQNDS